METILKSNAMYTFIKNTLVNQVTLVGNMGDCPRIFTNDNGSKIARFSLATDVKCKEGKKTEWYPVFAWGNIAHFLEKFGDKGKKIIITGKLVTRTFMNKEGMQQKVTEIELRNVIGL